MSDIFLYFHSFANQSTFLDGVIVFVAQVLPYFVVLGTIGFLIFHHEIFLQKQPFKAFLKKSHEILFSFVVGLCALFLAEVVKNIFEVLRPFSVMPSIENLFQATGYAFPSGHSTFFMALAFSVYFIHKKVGFILIIFALVIGTGRVMAGVHYPTDVLGGFVFGFFIAVTFNYLLKVNKKS